MIVKNGRVALPGATQFQYLDIEIAEGKITRIESGLSGTEQLDATDLLILPGGIDPHVHFDEPGYTEREDFYHGSCTAASGGITTIVDMPCTSVPPVTNLQNLRQKLEVIEQRSVVDFGLYGGVSSQSCAEDFPQNMIDLAEYVLGYKTYFISGMESFGHLNSTQFSETLQTAGKINRPVLLHAEDLETVRTAETKEKTKGNGWDNYYRSRPEAAEVIAVKKAIDMVKRTNAQLHIVHLSTAEAAHLLAEEAQVTGETAPHYLEFDYHDLEQIGSALKTTPVVKSPGNAEELWRLLQEGSIDFVASDHAPAPEEQKNTGSVWTEYAGIPGTGTLLPYMISEGFFKRKMPLDRFLKITAENAAKQYGIFGRKGSIEVGKDADLVLVNPNQEWKVHGKDFYSKGKLTPFEDRIFKGRIMKTILRGEIIYDYAEGICVSPGFGNYLKANSGK